MIGQLFERAGNALDESVRLWTLRQEPYRAILRAHSDAETERLEREVFPLVEHQHPSLKSLIESIRAGGDPITDIIDTESRCLKVFRYFRAEILLALSKAQKQDQQVLRSAVEAIGNLELGSKQMRTARIMHYEQLAMAVNYISKREEVPVERTVREIPYRDEVTRTVFPERGDAEEFLFVAQKYHLHKHTWSKALINVLEGTPELTGGKVESLEKLPTDEALSAFHQAVLVYKRREFDRIYALA